MAIQIVANSNANAVELRGTNRGVFYNACLSAQLNLDDSSRVDIINDIRTAAEGELVYETFAIPYTELRDADNNAFATAQDAVDYITAECNQIVGSGARSVGATNTINFTTDATGSTVLVDDGSAYAKNALRAYAASNGHISIAEHTSDGADVYKDIYVTNLTIDGVAVSTTLASAVNELNAVLSGAALGLGGVTVSPTLPYQAPTAATLNLSSYMTQVTATLAGASSSAGLHRANIYTTETISEPGEYFTAVIEGGEAIWGVGLYDINDLAEVQDVSAAYNGHKGYFFSTWWHPTPDGPWSTFGYLGGSMSFGSGWNNGTLGFRYNQEAIDWANGDPILVRAGITEEPEGFVGVWYWNNSRAEWILVARSSNPMPYGEYGFKFAAGDTSSRIHTTGANAIKIYELDTSGTAVNYYYIESPDGSFDSPLFDNASDAQDYDTAQGGSGQSNTMVYVDDAVTGRQWFAPVTGFTQGDSSAPSPTAQVWNIIPTQDDALFAPAAFTLPDVTVDENTALNIQVAPQGATGYSTTVSGLPAGALFDGATTILGNAPEVTGNNVSNPSDSFTVTVTRTNTYGSTTSTFDIIVTNLTAPATAIAGTTWVSGTTALVDSDTLDEGSAVTLDDTLADGQRLVVPQTWTETYVLPQLQAVGDEVFFGVQASGANLADGSDYSDYDMAIVWEYTSATSHTVNFIANGSRVDGVTVNSMADAVYDFGFELNGTTGYILYCNVGSINTEPSPADGGSFTFAESATGMTGPLTFTMATNLTTLDIDLSDFSEITTPAAPSSSTTFSKALDFSGSSEYAKQVATYGTTGPLRMGDISSNIAGPTTAGYTAYGSSVRPWATAVVFRYDGSSANQHIWNQGEGAGSTDDNIYLRLDSSGYLYFGWGRTGALNECRFLHLGTGVNTSHWHGIYIAHTGERLSGSDATAANLADCFDIRSMGSNDTPSAFSTISTNLSTAANWTAGSTGGRMDRSYTGDFTIGGRGSNRNFHGEIASMVVTTLRIGQPMPDTTEVEMLLTDPVGWLADYKVGSPYRQVNTAGDDPSFLYDWFYSSRATQVWLMGDGTSDNYPNIRNQVKVSDTTETSLAMQNMVSSDIVNVSISGLS